MRAIDAPALHIIRNPLDIVQSAYYSHLSTHPLSGWPQLEMQRRILANCSKEDGIFLTLAFLEQHEFYPRTPGPLHALRHWRFDDPRISTIRMEDLIADVNGVLGNRVLESLGKNIRLPELEEFTFERVSGGRRVGEVDDTSHYRSGLAGKWRSELPEAAIAYCRQNFSTVLERYYPDALYGSLQPLWPAPSARSGNAPAHRPFRWLACSFGASGSCCSRLNSVG